eukprot:1183852-Prorocentrum_minimum.AAC.1
MPQALRPKRAFERARRSARGYTMCGAGSGSQVGCGTGCRRRQTAAQSVSEVGHWKAPDGC